MNADATTQADASAQELLVRSARQVSAMLAILSRLLGLWWLARGSAGVRFPEWILFAGTLVAAGGVIYSPTHEVLGYKAYALVAPMASFTFAVIASVRPWQVYARAPREHEPRDPHAHDCDPRLHLEAAREPCAPLAIVAEVTAAQIHGPR